MYVTNADVFELLLFTAEATGVVAVSALKAYENVHPAPVEIQGAEPGAGQIKFLRVYVQCNNEE
ncbi:MAG: hypothetical protein Roseis2KO_52170 [Roseivirga sp.]